MRIGVVGINHKLADLKLREQLAKTCQKRFGVTQSFHYDHHFILLSTCNRTEIYFSSTDLAETHSYLLNILRYEVDEEFDQKLYSYFGLDCFLHLVRVTTGLDSAILTETEIQGQVKTAYETTTPYCVLPKELHFLFQKSLAIAKKIRHELQLGRGMPNLEQAVLNTGKQFFNNIEETRILFVGASKINQKIISYFRTKTKASITLCNRSHNTMIDLAKGQGIHVLDWNYLSNWIDYDWIIFGTKSTDYLITNKHLTNPLKHQKLIIDLSVPRNVEPILNQHPFINLMNIDQINRLLRVRSQHLQKTVIEAEAKAFCLTQDHVNRYLKKEHSKITVLAVTA